MLLSWLLWASGWRLTSPLAVIPAHQMSPRSLSQKLKSDSIMGAAALQMVLMCWVGRASMLLQSRAVLSLQRSNRGQYYLYSHLGSEGDSARSKYMADASDDTRPRKQRIRSSTGAAPSVGEVPSTSARHLPITSAEDTAASSSNVCTSPRDTGYGKRFQGPQQQQQEEGNQMRNHRASR